MSLTFNIDLGGTVLEDPQLAEVGPVLERATLAAAEFVKGLWIRRAQQLNIRRTGAYIRGIQQGETRITKKDIGDDLATISVDIINVAEHAQLVEEGHEAFSLPTAIQWGRTEGRIKRSEKGEPYLHIPFRHRAYASPAQAEPGGYTRATMSAMMPSHITRAARNLRATVKRNVGPIRAASGQFIQADRYHWGGRLDRSHTQPAKSHDVPNRYGHEHRGPRQVGRDSQGNPLVNPAWKSSKYHGLFKSTEGGGGARHTAYMTIRTVTPRSSGWNIPAQPGKHIARQVAHVVSHGRAGQHVMQQIGASIAQALSIGGTE